MNELAEVSKGWRHLRLRFLMWNALLSLVSGLVGVPMVHFLLELGRGEVLTFVVFVLVPTAVVVVVPQVLLSGWLCRSAVESPASDRPGDRLTRLLELPRRLELWCMAPTQLAAGVVFAILAVVVLDRPLWLLAVGPLVGVPICVLVGMPLMLLLQHDVEPYALEEYRRAPSELVQNFGISWPRNAWYLPLSFVLLGLSVVALGVICVSFSLAHVEREVVSMVGVASSAQVSQVFQRVALWLVLATIVLSVAVIGAFALAGSLIGRRERRAARAIETSLSSIASGTPAPPAWLGTDEMGDVAFAVGKMSREVAATFQQLKAMAHGSLDVRLEGDSPIIVAFRNSQRVMTELSAQMRALSRGTAVSSSKLDGDLGEAFSELNGALSAAISHAKTIARGDLRNEVQLVGELGGAMQQMTANLRAIAGQTQVGGDKISEVVVALRSAAAQLSAAITEQVSALSETANTMTEMAQTSAASADRAAELIKQGEAATAVVERGQSGAGAAVEAISNIASALGKVAGLSGTLALKVQQVDTIIETVGFLADQSSTLAINAAIEASRAGDAGKGFAAVAREMRTLAADSRKATGQIREILQEIRQHTGLVDSSVADGSATVDDGVRLVEQVGEAIVNLGVTIQDTVGLMRQVEGSARQHQAGVNQVSQALRSMQGASESIRDGAKMLTTMSEQTHELAGVLKQAAGSYQLPPTTGIA